MASPTIANVYQDPLLTDVSVRYSNEQDNLVAEKVFPVLPVAKRSGVFFTYNKENLRVNDDLRSPNARANQVEFNLTKTPYGPLLEHSLEEPIDWDTRNHTDAPADLNVDATLNVTEKVMLQKEITLATMMSDTSQVTQNVTLSGTSQWSDYTNSNPFGNVQTAHSTILKNGLKKANTFVCSQLVWDQLVNHTAIIQRIQYSMPGFTTEQIVARAFNVDNVIVARGVYNSAVEGQSDSLGYIWGKHAWLMYIAPTPGIRTVSGGYHLTITQNGATNEGTYKGIDRWSEPWRKTDVVRYTDYYTPFIVAPEAIYLFKNAVA